MQESTRRRRVRRGRACARRRRAEKRMARSDWTRDWNPMVTRVVTTKPNRHVCAGAAGTDAGRDPSPLPPTPPLSRSRTT
jgi:hypothetical protein